jgi:hypothetical protein
MATSVNQRPPGANKNISYSNDLATQGKRMASAGISLLISLFFSRDLFIVARQHVSP